MCAIVADFIRCRRKRRTINFMRVIIVHYLPVDCAGYFDGFTKHLLMSNCVTGRLIRDCGDTISIIRCASSHQCANCGMGWYVCVVYHVAEYQELGTSRFVGLLIDTKQAHIAYFNISIYIHNLAIGNKQTCSYSKRCPHATQPAAIHLTQDSTWWSYWQQPYCDCNTAMPTSKLDAPLTINLSQHNQLRVTGKKIGRCICFR